MANNKTFFKSAQEGQMSLKDIFSDVLKKHTPDESARVFIAGTSLTTPDEAEMLRDWQKPFLFARYFLICFATLLVNWGLFVVFGNDICAYVVMVGIPILVPFSVLLLAWEMNIPRSISLMETLKIVALGGVMSIAATLFLGMWGILPGEAVWAGLTEEPAKLLIIYILLKRNDRKYILEGVLLGMAVGTGFAIMETLGYVLRNFSADGYYAGLYVALLRGFNGIVGHGVYAALYGGALMIAKGAEPIQPRHLLHPTHLKYFGVSVLIHALNNSGLSEILPSFLGGLINTMTFLKIALAVFFFLPLLRQGVNQVVDATLQYNGGRLTFAVERKASGSQGGRAAKVTIPVEPPKNLVIHFTAGPEQGRTVRVGTERTVTLGRVEGRCDVALPGCSKVSGCHCTVQLSGGNIVVTDLGSTNGTYVDSKRLMPDSPTSVANGAVIYLGSRDCAFQVSLT